MYRISSFRRRAPIKRRASNKRLGYCLAKTINAGPRIDAGGMRGHGEFDHIDGRNCGTLDVVVISNYQHHKIATNSGLKLTNCPPCGMFLPLLRRAGVVGR